MYADIGVLANRASVSMVSGVGTSVESVNGRTDSKPVGFSVIERERTRLMDGHRDRRAQRLWVSGPSKLQVTVQKKKAIWEQDIIT